MGGNAAANLSIRLSTPMISKMSWPIISLFLALGCSEPTPVQTESLNQEQTLSYEDHARQSKRAMQMGQYADAVKHAQAVIDLRPESIEYYMIAGEASFMMGNMEKAIVYFDRLIDLTPRIKPQLWQRGLALYYAKKYEQGKEQFESHQNYNSEDVENAVWHLLCHSRLVDLEEARKSFIPITQDRRIPMKQIHKLFGGNGSVESVMDAVGVTPDDERRPYHEYYAQLYIGLYYDMIGESEKSMAAMRKAAKVNPIAKNQLMGRVADVHLLVRGKQANE